METKKELKSVDDYISLYPPEIRKRMNEIRAVIRKKAPQAIEKISYQMPAYTYKDMMLLYFAGHSRHIGFYPLTTAITAFKEKLSGFKTAKGSIQFPNDEPLPVKLISDIVSFRVKENEIKAELKKSRKKSPGKR